MLKTNSPKSPRRMQARWKVLADGGSPVSAGWLKLKVLARFDNWDIMLI